MEHTDPFMQFMAQKSQALAEKFYFFTSFLRLQFYRVSINEENKAKLKYSKLFNEAK